MSRNKATCEYKRIMAKQRFDQVRGAMIENGRWLAPHRVKWLLSQQAGSRTNQHIVDPTHVLAHRSYIAGFLEGNTSATRPWSRAGTDDHELDMFPTNHDWLDRFTRRYHEILSKGNYYNAAAIFYGDFGCFNTGAHYIDELPQGRGLFFHTLEPGTYYVLNDGFGKAIEMVREFSLTVKALVDYYGVKEPNGKYSWDNFSPYVKKMYDESQYTQTVDVCHQMYMNPDFDPQLPVAGANRQWASKTYELGTTKSAEYAQEMTPGSTTSPGPEIGEKYLKMGYSKRQPFIVGKSDSSQNFEYGEDGPMTRGLGLVKSLNKKAITKDQALEQMVKPAMQGPANLRKSYITTQANSYVPLDPMSVAKGGGLRPVIQIDGMGMSHLTADQADLRRMVDKLFYADFLLYLSQNPKTRTATETDAIVKEQQLVIGPNLQSLNWTYNVPVVEFVMDYVLFDDPWILDNPVPESLAGKLVKPTFISVFAQAQRAADLPAIRQYIAAVTELGQLNPQVFQKANLDKILDIYEDRLFLPAGINYPQDQVDAKREQAAQQQQRQMMLTEALPAMAGAAKDVGLKVANQ